MTTIAPNPHSPYADANPNHRHLFSLYAFFGGPTPGRLADTACQRLAVVPERLTEALPDSSDLPEDLCPACVAAMRGEELPEDVRPVTDCRTCESSTDHDGLCAMCRMEQHDTWWPTRDTAATA